MTICKSTTFLGQRRELRVEKWPRPRDSPVYPVHALRHLGGDTHHSPLRDDSVFSIDFFKENPKPFYLLSKEIMPQPEKYRPTPTHFFLKLLEEEGLLRRVYTQNIDCLERVCGLSAEKLVECHGTYAKAACIGWCVFKSGVGWGVVWVWVCVWGGVGVEW